MALPNHLIVKPTNTYMNTSGWMATWSPIMVYISGVLASIGQQR